MKGELPLEKLATLTIVMIMVAVGIQIMQSLEENVEDTNIQLKKAYPSVNYPYCSDYSTGENISREGFYKIMYYRLSDTCNLTEQKLTSDFVLKKSMLEEKAREVGLEDSDGDLLIFYRGSCSGARDTTLQGLVLGKDEKEFLYRPGDTVNFIGTGEEVKIC